MENFYNASLDSLESYIDAAGFRLVSLDLPSWYINKELKVVFASQANWDSVVEKAPVILAPGLDQVLSSPRPPSLDFFLSLPTPGLEKEWAVYVLIITHPNLPPMLYIGSGTNAKGGVQTREVRYLNETGALPSLVARAKLDGYTIEFRVLCWTPLPPADLVPRLRARFLVLEAVFTVVFCACVKMIMDEVFIPDFYLWSRESVTWKPACTHLSLSESVRADLQLTPEELIHANELRLQRDAEKTKRYRKRQREEDEESYLRNNLEQHQSWSERNLGRVNEIAAGVRNKAKELQRFRCDVCDHNAASEFALNEHNKTQSHLKAIAAGGKVLKPLSAAALNMQASRANALANRTHYCKPCDKAFPGAHALKRHQTQKKHIEAAARQQQ